MDEKIEQSTGDQLKLILIGNPNVGKSVLFGIITGSYVVVSNYPGTTVEITTGKTQLDGHPFKVLDTPGINNLIPITDDERATRNILLTNKPDVVLQVADTKNIRRALIISTQLQEMNIPLVLSLNMADEAKRLNIKVDTDKLAKILDIPVVSTVATQEIGTDTLKKELLKPKKPKSRVIFDYRIENAIEEIIRLLPSELPGRRAVAIMVLAGDTDLEKWLEHYVDKAKIQKTREISSELSQQYPHSMEYIINRQRLQWIDEILEGVFVSGTKSIKLFPERLSYVMLHPVWGMFFLIGVLYAVYQFVGVLGAGTGVDFLNDFIFDKYINPWFIYIVQNLIPLEFVQNFLVGEYGIITMAVTYGVAIVLPIVVTFFLSFSVLEDCGYLPRLSAMLDKIFKVLGLNGKAILPMVLGLGCVTMAVITTRILETRRERLLTTFLLALGIPCSAQMGVIAGMMTTLSFNAIIVWLFVIAGILLAVGYLASKIVPGSTGDFIMELPPVRMPKFKNIIIKTIGRVEWYAKEVIPLFILGTAVLFLLDEFHLLEKIQHAATPIVEKLLGLPAKATDAFLIGFFRRDYGAAGLFHLQMQGMLDTRQVLVSMVTITLFIPCIATVFMIWKELGWKVSIGMLLIIFPFAFIVGGILNQTILYWNITF